MSDAKRKEDQTGPGGDETQEYGCSLSGFLGNLLLSTISPKIATFTKVEMAGANLRAAKQRQSYPSGPGALKAVGNKVSCVGMFSVNWTA
ncbi:hypothetical protein HNQ77_002135 [Silvibacterium bohemicum]|uniref:Uncharacterized protein n=1 Tax=Silvibacterium bohemicum TaxID=1577686 RepID=A0A841JRZ8_9BACT|nr:hypothetical protein [Silvibacterium bohemicum]MBB6144183.1 hypothetical protein [Silvibacterium bohemicum]